MLEAPLYQSTDLGNECWGTRARRQGNEGMRRFALSECVLLGYLRVTLEWGRNCWSMSRYTIPVMVESMKKGPYTFLCWRRKIRSPLGCHEHFPGRHMDFRYARPCSCGYWPYRWHEMCFHHWKLRSPEISLNLNSLFSHIEPQLTGKTRYVFLHSDSSKQCRCPLNKFK
jgi:hypothetical protein